MNEIPKLKVNGIVNSYPDDLIMLFANDIFKGMLENIFDYNEDISKQLKTKFVDNSKSYNLLVCAVINSLASCIDFENTILDNSKKIYKIDKHNKKIPEYSEYYIGISLSSLEILSEEMKLNEIIDLIDNIKFNRTQDLENSRVPILTSYFDVLIRNVLTYYNHFYPFKELYPNLNESIKEDLSSENSILKSYLNGYKIDNQYESLGEIIIRIDDEFKNGNFKTYKKFLNTVENPKSTLDNKKEYFLSYLNTSRISRNMDYLYFIILTNALLENYSKYDKFKDAMKENGVTPINIGLSDIKNLQNLAVEIVKPNSIYEQIIYTNDLKIEGKKKEFHKMVVDYIKSVLTKSKDGKLYMEQIYDLLNNLPREERATREVNLFLR